MKLELQQRQIIDAASTIRCAALALQDIPLDSPLYDASTEAVLQLYDISETLYLLAGREDLIPEYPK